MKNMLAPNYKVLYDILKTHYNDPLTKGVGILGVLGFPLSIKLNSTIY